ncbi:MAG: NAD-dependent epimerase/dehydratase family protein [Clostridiales bacterium]|nr:NAD-dependent epimerase/dehydratase family protein [Clostridiales bacterium]
MGTYIITGACGHLGSTIARALAARGERVRALALPGESDRALQGLNVEIVRGDVLDSASLDALFIGPGAVVIHAAGIISIKAKSDPMVRAVNVEGTRNVIDACRRRGARRLVYVSSVHAIPDPPGGQEAGEVARFDPDRVEGLYARTKAEATQLVLDAAKWGLDAVVVHPSGIIGPGDWGRGHMTQLAVDFMRGRLTAAIRGGFDFVDVRDVADGVIAAADRAKAGECYILSNRFYSVDELLGLMADAGRRKKIKTVLPRWFVGAVAPLCELWYRMRRQTPLFTRYSIATLSGNVRYSHAKAERGLGYRTRDMKKTVEDTIAFLREIGRIPKGKGERK